jgi:CHASE2 domain-containing sensor protein
MIGFVLLLIAPAVIFAYPVLQVVATLYSRGTNRWLSLTPLPIAAWLLWGYFKFRHGGGNLYPIFPILLCPILDAVLLSCILSERAKRFAAPSNPIG